MFKMQLLKLGVFTGGVSFPPLVRSRHTSFCLTSPRRAAVMWIRATFVQSEGQSVLTAPSPLRSAYTVLKFVMMWTLVLLADFILEFRLEYLWPCWLFFGSVYTTFHCHGLVTLCFSLRNSALEAVKSTLCFFTNGLFLICRLSVSFLSALPSPWTSFVSFLFLYIGSSLSPAHTSYLTTFGTQVSA